MAHIISTHQGFAGKPTLAPHLAKALKTMWVWRRRWLDRRETRRLLERADDRMLQDVGLNRATLADVSGRPFWKA